MDAMATMFDSGNLPLLKKALSAYALRHRVIADNISNVATEGYRAQKVDFESLLQEKAELPVPGLRTHPGHMAIGPRQGIEQPEVVEQKSGFDNGVNDVDVDREMVAVGQNQLMYRMVTRLLNSRYEGLKTAITGQVRR